MKKFLISFLLVTLPLILQTVLIEGGPIALNDSIINGNGVAVTKASYGQLYFSSSQSISLNTADEWVAIPFDAFSPSLNMDGSTSSPATITVLESGVYQINVSLYFFSEDSPEDTYNPTFNTLGTKINDSSIVACANVFAGEIGLYSITYSTLMELSANDTVEFYIQTSIDGGGPPFANLVTMLQGNANLIQIAN